MLEVAPLPGIGYRALCVILEAIQPYVPVYTATCTYVGRAAAINVLGATTL